jgi:hypothetical protein
MKPNYESINAICPIHAASERDRPLLTGTGTLLDFGKARFLVTAAHVYDEYSQRHMALYIPAGTMGALVELSGEAFSTSIPKSGKRSDDRLDLSFVCLNDVLADEVAKARYFLPFSLIDVNDRLKPASHYMFTGFPANRDRAKYGQKKVASKRYGYTGKTISTKRMHNLGINENTHIAVEFNRMETLDENNQPAPFPVPYGMSGGAVWTGDGDHSSWFSTAPARLVGIGIEVPENQNVLVAVRIHVVLAAIAKAYPSLSEFIPFRQGFTASVNIRD